MSGMDFTMAAFVLVLVFVFDSVSLLPDFRLLSDTFDTLSSDRRFRPLILPFVFGGGNRSGTSLSGLPGPGYEVFGSARPIRRDGNGIDGGGFSAFDC